MSKAERFVEDPRWMRPGKYRTPVVFVVRQERRKYLNGAVDLWSDPARAAFEEYHARVDPSWRRKLAKSNSAGTRTPEYAQAEFEYEAILKEARRLYHNRLLGIRD